MLVGNEAGEDLRRVPLDEVRGDLRGDLHNPRSWPGQVLSLNGESIKMSCSGIGFSLYLGNSGTRWPLVGPIQQGF